MGFSSRPQGITTPIILIQLGRLADSDMESTRLINGAFQNLPFTKAPGSFFESGSGDSGFKGAGTPAAMEETLRSCQQCPEPAAC